MGSACSFCLPTHVKSILGPAPQSKHTRLTPEKDERLVNLKEIKYSPLEAIEGAFPGRSIGSLQVHYSTKLSSHNDLGGQWIARHRPRYRRGSGGEQGEGDAMSETRPKRRRGRPRKRLRSQSSPRPTDFPLSVYNEGFIMHDHMHR
jgi:hypothetical protein